jgi:hypothetical protein
MSLSSPSGVWWRPAVLCWVVAAAGALLGGGGRRCSAGWWRRGAAASLLEQIWHPSSSISSKSELPIWGVRLVLSVVLLLNLKANSLFLLLVLVAR